YTYRTPLHVIKRQFDVNPRIIERIIKKLVDKIPEVDFSNNKLGGPGRIVQIDETMLNFKCKSHRGRPPGNKTDALCIIEINNKITRVFATVIPDKKAETIIPIIFNQVTPNSIIWTDEHPSYSSLSSLNFIHDTVCHKYSFMNNKTGANTQAVESFHNELKREIKNRKGIKTDYRKVFLKEWCFYYNNRHEF
ncbi:hypothetical protein DMUE_6377, partial [Dictyocoela muelleri]